MSTRTTRCLFDGGLFFLTFTCFEWRPLFEISNGYDVVYTWFDHLAEKGHRVHGYVVMPNHVHCLIGFSPLKQSLGTVVGNGKRFMAYEIINRLETNGETVLLQHLYQSLTYKERERRQLHRVFEESFDAKLVTTHWFLRQKLAYIHNNPVRGKWALAASPELYPHSSAGCYAGNRISAYSKIILL